MWFNHRDLAIPTHVVQTPNARSKMEPSIVSARLIMSEIRTARVARNAFSTLIVPAIRVALVIDVSILVRELAALMPSAG